jgi:2-keto-4-pentenoate hydratase
MMKPLNPSVFRDAQDVLFRHWRKTLQSGANRLGWKIGINDPRAQRFYGLKGTVVGYLTDTSILAGARPLTPELPLMVEPELGLVLSHAVDPAASPDVAARAIGCIRPALEFLDFDQPRQSLEDLMSHNIFHLGVALGDEFSVDGVQTVRVRIEKDGRLRNEITVGDALPPLGEIVARVARLLSLGDERLVPGDVIISGSLTPAIPLELGQNLSISFGPLGTLESRRDPDGLVRTGAA